MNMRLEIYNRMTTHRLQLVNPACTLEPGESWSGQVSGSTEIVTRVSRQSGALRVQGVIQFDPAKGVRVDRGALVQGQEDITLGVTLPGGQYLQTHSTGGAWVLTPEQLARGGTISLNYLESV